MPVKVLIDHKDLEYFMTTKMLTLKQVKLLQKARNTTKSNIDKYPIKQAQKTTCLSSGIVK